MSDTPSDTGSTRAPDTDIAALLTRLDDPSAPTRKAAADELGENGPRAHAALDALKQRTTEDDDYAVRLASALAVWRIEPEDNQVVDVLQAELKNLSARYTELTSDETADDSEDLLDSIFETLQQIQALVRALAEMGPGAAGTAADLMMLLAKGIGEGYVDLVPDVVYALAAQGSQAKSVLPALQQFRGTTPGRQNRDVVDAAIRSIETGQPPPAASRPITDVD